MTITQEYQRYNGLYLASELQWLRRKFEHWNAAHDVDDSVPLDVADAQLVAADDARIAAAAESPFPALAVLSEQFLLNTFEREVMLLCVAMELDPLTGQRCRTVNLDGAPYPTFALALRLFDQGAWDALSPWRPLRAARLITVAAAAGQGLVTAPLLAEEAVLHFVKGLQWVTSYPNGSVHSHLDHRLATCGVPTSTLDIALPPSHLKLVEEILAGWSDGAVEPEVFNLVGPSAAGSRQVAATAAQAAGYELFRIDVTDLLDRDVEELAALWSRDRRLHPVAVLLEADELQPDVVRAVTRFLKKAGGLRFLASRQHMTLGPIPHRVVDVRWMSTLEQQLLWSESLPTDQAGLATQLADRFRLDAATIVRLANTSSAHVGDAEAVHKQARDGDAGHDESTRLVRRCRDATRPDLAGLASWSQPRASWRDLVVPAPTANVLRDIVVHVQHRNKVLQDWGFGGRSSRGRGTSALFSGPTGTGKTLAAEVLAHELDTPLCSVDLAAVVSKYIGETEKNLSRVFDAAEASNALLLFDEADALFGRRSQVRDSHDRYANVEVSYLLQRFEAFDGLAVLSTNMADALDVAFLRRLRFVVTFEFPAAPERKRIWSTVFPPAVPVDEPDLDALASIPVTGATIRNIALHAAFAAAHCGGSVTQDLIISAAERELEKTGQPLPRLPRTSPVVGL